jgi:Fic family protein
MNPDIFRKGGSGQVIQIGRGETAFWAFLPNPLPPDLDFDRSMVNSLSSADRALGELAGLGRTIPNPHLLIGPFVRREAVLSSRIEGTQTDIADLYAFEAGQMKLPGLTQREEPGDAREVFNYVRAMEYGIKRQETIPISLRLLREVHGKLMEGARGERATPGEFRRSQNWIGPPGCKLNEANFVPPPVDKMNEALSDFEKFLHEDLPIPPLIRLAMIHYQFEAIHPFLDGNGRVGRLLISLLLVNWGLLPQPLLYLSAFFERKRQDYYDLLMAVSQRNDWKSWFQFFLSGVTEQARDAVLRAKNLQDIQTNWRSRLMDQKVSGGVFKIVDKLFENPIVTIPEAQQIMGVKQYATARKAINVLESVGILEKTKDMKYGKTYIARAILRELGR